MICHSVLFGKNPAYESMARVLAHTVGKNSPATPLVLHRIIEPDEDLIEAINKRPNVQSRKQLYLDNARKTKHHTRIVHEAKDGEVLCLLDADMMVLGDLSDVAETLAGRELAYTVRPERSRYPFNTGVVFVRVCSEARAFFWLWEYTVREMLAKPAFHAINKTCFGGINQAAFGYLVANLPAYRTDFLMLSCEYYNCEHDCLKRKMFDRERTKVVHIHGTLRRVLFNAEQTNNEQVLYLADVWRKFEAEAKGVAA